ncbi:hypothetical protein KI387_017290, partial [Taxus chinensis]
MSQVQVESLPSQQQPVAANNNGNINNNISNNVSYGVLAAAASNGSAENNNNQLAIGTSLYVGDLDASVNEAQLYDLFKQWGNIQSIRVCRDMISRRSLGYAYVNFATPQEASRAIGWCLISHLSNGKPIRIMYSHRDPSIRKSGTANIFIKVMRDPTGQSRGSGFVAFSSPEEANRAAYAWFFADSGVFVKFEGLRPLLVSPWILSAQFAVRNPVGMQPPAATSLPMYPPGSPGLGQQIFYGQGPPQLIPPQPSGYGYQQQFVPGMRPGGAQLQNYFVPLFRQGQQGQRPGARRTPLQQQQQQPQPQFQQQMIPRGSRVMRHPPVRNVPE